MSIGENTMAKTFEQLVPAPKGRFDGISRPYSPAEVESGEGQVVVRFSPLSGLPGTVIYLLDPQSISRC